MAPRKRNHTFNTHLAQVFGKAYEHETFPELYATAIGRSRSTFYRRLQMPTEEEVAMLELLMITPIENWPERWTKIVALMNHANG